MKKVQVNWKQSLKFKGIIGFVALTLWLITGVYIVMHTKGRQLILQESERVIEETMNQAVGEIQSRLQEIQALARSVKEIAERLPKQTSAVKSFLPFIINFQGDRDVAGGGFWPEPYKFHPKINRRSFFWGRNERGVLQYFNDYNDPKGPGYINEEWYVPARYSTPNRCYWSKSYMDAYSYEPMTTCTVGTYENEIFSGTITIDVKLSGLSKFAEKLSKKTGGYIFIVDRNDRFLTFPKPRMVKNYGKDSKGNKTEKFLVSSEFAAKEPLFKPIADEINEMSIDIIQKAQEKSEYRNELTEKIRIDSMHAEGPQIETPESKTINAMLSDPLRDVLNNSNLYKKFNIKNDLINKNSSVVFLFHVPSAYWKVVVVKPLSEVNSVSIAISRLMTIYIAITILIASIIGYILLSRALLKPLASTTATILRLEGLVSAEKFDQVRYVHINSNRKDEIGLLTKVFASFVKILVKSHDNMQKVSQQELETKRLENIELQAKVLEKEIEATQLVQISLLPEEMNTESTNIAAYYQSASQAGGDWYGYHHDKDGEKVYLYIGDVTGHGVPSSLITGVAFGSIFSAQKMFEKIREKNIHINPEDFIINMAQVVNETILKSGEKSQRFMTMVFLCCDIKTGEVIYLNAGHTPIYLRHNDNKNVTIIPNPGNRLGYVEKLDVKVRKFTIAPNDSLFFYTDGLIENTGPNKERDIISAKKLKEILGLDLDSLEMKEKLISEMKRVWKDNPLDDDVTFMLFKWLGSSKKEV